MPIPAILKKPEVNTGKYVERLSILLGQCLMTMQVKMHGERINDCSLLSGRII